MPHAPQLLALAAFEDNYIWMLHDGELALVVDPGDATPVIEVLQARRLRLAGILVTHHHGDHIGGIEALRPWLDGEVHAPAHVNNPLPCVRVQQGDQLELMGLRLQVLATPGHTLDHIAYHLAEPGDGGAGLLFCGDTLFSAGCGRLFEGSPAQMLASLKALCTLPGETRVCCAHEYTLSNLRFARTIEPANAAVQEHEAWCLAQRDRLEPTLPSTLALEQEINPFLRCRQPAVQSAVHAHRAGLAQEATPGPDTELAVFAALRQWKNEFR